MGLMTLFPIIITVVLLMGAIISLIYRMTRDFGSEDITAQAELIDKHSTIFDQYGKFGQALKEINVLVFNVNGKVVKFEVDRLAWEYAGKGEHGTLTYNGNRYIDFHVKKRSIVKNKMEIFKI